jgi:Protein of unknown function (DUF1569)
MKSFFDRAARDELLSRLESLRPDMSPRWGKMNAAQMLAHCGAPYRAATGDIVLKPMPWLMRVIGRMIKKTVLSEKPYKKNAPTAPEFRFPSNVDFSAEKQRFLESFRKLAVGPQMVKSLNHPFFGPMTTDEWGIHMYKHTDHHFTQFGI